MAHMVKCKVCGERFDRDKVPCVLISARRYAHTQCASKQEESLSQEEKDKKELNDYINFLFGPEAEWARIRKQIKTYTEEYKYTYSGIRKTLYWWYEVQGNSTEKANGAIGIVPYVYQSSKEYWFTLFKANESNKHKEDLSTLEEITIKSPRARLKKVKLFWEDEDE